MNLFFKLNQLYSKFSSGNKGLVGFSELGESILYFKVQKTPYPVIISQYSIHAREYITSYLALRQIEDFLNRGKKGTVYFIPVLNPDGVRISMRVNPLYKANANGVDLNVNFDARWGTGELNIRSKGDANFIGNAPFSESESRALRDFTYLVKPQLTLSYHSKGEEIYYEFFQTGKIKERDYNFANIVKDCTGYQIKSTPNSAGGYKDWCIQKLGIPALTIEVGSDNLSHPIGSEYTEQIFSKNKDVLIKLTESELWKKNL